MKTPRPAPHPGPRCYTHHQAKKKADRQKRRDGRLEQVYSITREEKDRIQEAQGGGCICYKWTGYNGRTRDLSVDHDHKTGLVRGVLCKHCNDLLGRVGDDPEYFRLMYEYLSNPPARQVVGERVAQGAPRANPVLD
jgi:hypothetical protein